MSGAIDPGTMLTDDYATIRLLDNDNNSTYEVIFVDCYTYLKVANVDYITGYVSFVDALNNFIDLSGSDVDRLCTIYNAEGKEVELFEVTNNIIVGVKSSADGLIHEIAMCPDQTVSGEVTAYDEENNAIALDGVTYEMSKAFIAKNIVTNLVKVGDNISAYVGLNGQLVYLDDTKSEYVYGYLTNVKKTEGVDEKLMLEIFTQQGYTTFYAAEKLGVDSFGKFSNVSDAVAEMSAVEVETTIVDGKTQEEYVVTPSVIKYTTNKDGEITHIDFPKDKTTGYDPTENLPSYDSLVKVQSGKKGNYRPGVSGLVGTVILSNATMIVDLGSTKDKEERYFYTSSGSLENNYSYTMDLYDVDEHGYAGFAFVTDGPTDSSKSTSLKTYIIEKCSRGIAEDYEGYNITCYGGGAYGTYFLPEESLEEGSYTVNVNGNDETVKGKRQPKAGDLVRFTIESGNIIDEYYVDYMFEADLKDEQGAELDVYSKIIGNSTSNKYVNNASVDPKTAPYSSVLFSNAGYTSSYIYDPNGSSGAGYVTGYVYNSEKSMVLCNGPKGEYEFSSFRPYLVPTTVVLFDTQTRKVTVTPYMSSAIKTYKANQGSEDFVVLRNNAGRPETAFVYR
ncbi:MAG: hypothetical protein IJ365_07765 [Clostridia bacterium]|nr:hypothetical protein [Clostridia bacterium]